MSKMNRQYPALELDKVLELLAQHTSCEDARLAALNLEPQTDLASAQALMNQTRDAHMLITHFTVPMREARSVSRSFSMLRPCFML